MPNRTRTLPIARQERLWLQPLPHPSWSGEASVPDLSQPLLASEFWKRLGL